jgi:hypothetical protein
VRGYPTLLEDDVALAETFDFAVLEDEQSVGEFERWGKREDVLSTNGLCKNDPMALISLSRSWFFRIWLKSFLLSTPNVQSSRHTIVALRVPFDCSANSPNDYPWVSSATLNTPLVKVS